MKRKVFRFYVDYGKNTMDVLWKYIFVKCKINRLRVQFAVGRNVTHIHTFTIHKHTNSLFLDAPTKQKCYSCRDSHVFSIAHSSKTHSKIPFFTSHINWVSHHHALRLNDKLHSSSPSRSLLTSHHSIAFIVAIALAEALQIRDFRTKVKFVHASLVHEKCSHLSNLSSSYFRYTYL